MDDVANQLARRLQDAVAARFDGLLTAAGSGSTRLLFAALGRPVDPLQFALPSPAATLEATSGFVDCLPAPGTGFVADAGTFSDAYEGLVSFARPLDGLPEDVSTTVASQLAAARRRYDNSRIGRLGVPVPYVPTQQEPVRWFDPAGTHWTRLSVSEQQTSGPTGGDPGPIADSPPPEWAFRVPDRAASLDEWMHGLPERGITELAAPDRKLLAANRMRLVAVDQPSAVVASALDRGLDGLDQAQREPRHIEVSPRHSARPAGMERALVAEPATLRPLIGADGQEVHRHLREGVQFLGRADVLRDLVEDSTPVPTTSSSFSLELDYSLVSLQRVWLQMGWLESDEWCIPGYEPGEVSAGDPNVPGQQVAAFPVAFVAVKNVVVRAAWSQQDTQAVAAAAGLGPFVMAGAGFSAEAGALVIPGVQVIAWLCRVPPKLPPVPASTAG